MPQRIEFEGQIHEFPDDFTEAEISRMLQSAPPVGDAKPDYGRALQVGMQGVGRGAANLLGMPADLANAAADIPFQAADAVAELFGGDVDFRFGPSPLGSESIADATAQVIEAIGGDVIDPEDMTQRERYVRNVSSFGTEAATGGMGLAKRAAKIAVENIPVSALEEAILRPYMHGSSPRRVVGGDAAAGVGAGTGVTAAQENDLGPYGELIGAILGGVGGAIGADLPRSASIAGRNAGERMRPASEIAVDPRGNRVSQFTRRRAAEFAQSMATDTAAAGARIGERAAAARTAGDPLATAGLLSDDPGLVMAEKAARLSNPRPFIERDRQLADAASSRVSDLQDPGADQGAPGRRMAAVRDERTAPLLERQQAVETAYQRSEAQRQAQGAPLTAVARADARAEASGRVHRSIEDPYTEARAAKNQAFESIDPDRGVPVDAADVIAAAQEVRAGLNDLAPTGLQMPGEFVRALERLAPDMQMQNSPILDAAGRPVQREVNLGGDGTAALGDLVEVRKYLSTAYENARSSGNFVLAQNISALRRSINQTIERTPEAADANAQYRTFADRFRPSSGDEGSKFTREIDRGREPEPSRTAQRFLASPEKTGALRRMGAGGEAEAVRDYLRSDFASSALSADNMIDARRAENWVSKNAAALDQYPEVRREFDGLVEQARRGETMSEQLQQQFRDAQRATESEGRSFDRSILGDLQTQDPRNVASRMLSGSDYASARSMDEITQAIGQAPEAQRGWRASVAEVLSDKVRNVGAELGQEGREGPLSIAKMERVWNQHEDALRGVFSEQDMESLRRAHETLAPLQNRGVQASRGSPTAENRTLQSAWDALGTAMTLQYGAVHAGMILYRLKRMANLLPGLKGLTTDNKALGVVNRMWFDPDLARHLLETPVDQLEGPTWNKKLNQLLGVQAGISAGDRQEPDPVLQAITGN